MAVDIVVINLDRDASRLAHMRAQLSAAGLPFTRFAAIDGRDIPETLRAYFEGADASLTPGEIGCYASHLAICQQVAAGALPSPLLVLEDDVALTPGFAQVLRRLLDSLPEGWDIVRLSYPTKRACARVAQLLSSFELVRYSHVPTSTGAYLLSRAGARKFLARRKRALPVDHDLRRVWAWELDTFGVVPPPVRNDCLDSSSIGARGSPWRRRRLRLKRWLEDPRRHAHGIAACGAPRWFALEAANLAARLLPRAKRRALFDWARGALAVTTNYEPTESGSRSALDWRETQYNQAGPARLGAQAAGCVMSVSIGLDFGTTNTVATMINAAGRPEAVHFAHNGEAFDAFRSVLGFWETEQDDVRRTNVEAGPWAIDQFVELAGECRFIQSFKTFAASPLFTDTLIYSRRLKFEDLLSTFLRRVRAHAGMEFPKRIVVGRPVKFAGVAPDEALARTRYEDALRAVGFEDIHHVYEPVAAAYYFAQRLKADATILVADFGGGTSDFSVVRFSVGADGLRYTPLAHAGVGIAGDAFDYRIIDQVVARAFGKGSEYVSWGKVLPVPNGYFSKFSRWNELSIMRHSRDYRELQQLVRSSLDPDRIRAFLAFLDADAGYAMNRAISAVKMGLSHADESTLSFHVAGVDIERTITRANFEKWIAPELAEIDGCVGRVLADAGLQEAQIDRVFLTGGSSFVPAVRAQFEARFGAAKIETGDQLVSIAYGLALIAREQDISRWAA